MLHLQNHIRSSVNHIAQISVLCKKKTIPLFQPQCMMPTPRKYNPHDFKPRKYNPLESSNKANYFLGSPDKEVNLNEWSCETHINVLYSQTTKKEFLWEIFPWF